MRKSILAALAAGIAIVAAVLLLLKPPSTTAQPGDGGVPVNRQAQAAQLPISNIVLFSSGVGYFQRSGEVDGTARVDLSFPVEDINDLLKSLVVQDLNGGQISTVNYDSHDPIDKTLRSFALDLTSNPTFGQLLDQARGEKIEVTLQAGVQPNTLTGTIIGIERQKQPVGKENVIEVELLNLLVSGEPGAPTTGSIRGIPMSQVQRLRFLNPVLDNELKRALEVLARSHDTQKKAVSLLFTGDGKRQVRVSYVIENPIWKTSYRLVMEKDNKFFLQGWAVVENTSDDDWNNVRVVLVSGRPISFQMDLYQPLYVKRPVVEPELFASLRPPTYSGDLGKDKEDRTPAPPAMPAGPAGGGGRRGRGQEAMSEAKPQEEALARKSSTLELSRGVTSAATATQMGHFFHYNIDKPVTLPRQKSAMLPIVNQSVEGTKVSIYNPSVHAKFPLHGLKFKNTTGHHLMQGPITVFDGASYAGDARVLDLQPNEERLLSYAIDLGTEVEPVAKGEPERLISVKIVKGILHATHKLRMSMTYNVKNRSDQDRVLLIEHPFRPDWKLVTPEKPDERSREVYRFQLAVAAGKSGTRQVVEEQDRIQQIALTNVDDQTVRLYLTSNVSSPEVKKALEKAVELKNKLAASQREIANAEQQLRAIRDDQARIRENLGKVPQTSAAYKRYLEKFDSQETEIEKLQDQSKKLRQAEEQQRKEYEAYVIGLDVG